MRYKKEFEIPSYEEYYLTQARKERDAGYLFYGVALAVLVLICFWLLSCF